ncbi:MAG: peptidase dimerization domain-containing protein, partial [Pseudonocardiaceae bacterium]
ADAALLAEPTGSVVEAGCQGTMRAVVTMGGRRAHSARSWTGVNAIHRLTPILVSIAQYQARQVTIDGCRFREGLQIVAIGGGVAGNVVPDEAKVTINFRFAPDRTPAQAEAHVRSVIGPVDDFCVTDMAAAAAPDLGHPLLAALLKATGQPARAKLGWTDVARLAGRGLPATNFGPGDPNLAHSAEECVSRAELEAVYRAIRELIDG